MLLSGILIIGVVVIAITITTTLIIKKFFGISGVIFSGVVLGFFIGGLYTGYRVLSNEDPKAKYSYCSDYPVSEYTINVYFFRKDTLMGTKIGVDELYLAPYPASEVAELYITEDEINLVEGKILCIDASEGQIALGTMVNGCNP